MMDELDTRRRLFLGSAVGAAAMSSLATAQADTAFTNFSFPATGAPTPRTMPDRLSDVINVKDWGAIGNNTNNDGPAIQAAIDACIARGGGKVFFPTGNYRISGPLIVGSDTKDVGVQLIGTGKGASTFGTHSGYTDPKNFGYLIIKGNHTYDCIEHIEGLSFISAKCTRMGVAIVNCTIGPGGKNIGLDLTGAQGAMVYNIAGGASGLFPQDPANTNSPYPGSSVNTVGVALGTGVIAASRLMGGWGISYALSGYGSVLVGCSTETVGCACRVGWGVGADGFPAEVPSYGAIVHTLQTEREMSGVELYNANGAFVAANILTGTIGTPAEPLPVISNMSWSSANGGTVTVTTAVAHNLRTGSQPIALFWGSNQVWAAPPIPTHSTWDLSWGGVVMATRIDATHFSYPNPTNLSSARYDGQTNPARWSYPNRWAIRCRKVYNSLITSNQFNLFASYGSIDLDYNGEADHKNNIIQNTYANWGFIMPTNRKNLASWKFINAGGNLDWFGLHTANPVGYMRFADLPGQSSVLQPLIEGDQFDISDGALYGGGSANFGDRVQGGGSGHYKVRFDGTYWRRCG